MQIRSEVFERSC